jgi:hypothetical protein
MRDQAKVFPIRGLINYLLLSEVDIVYVDGARGGGTNEVVSTLVENMPNSILYTPLGHRKSRCVINARGAVVGGDAGLDIGQAHLGVLDFLEQCPVNETVIIDRSPLSSLVFEPEDPSSRKEVEGFLERIRRSNLRCAFILATSADGLFDSDVRTERTHEQTLYSNLMKDHLLSTDVPISYFEASRSWKCSTQGWETFVYPIRMTTRWQYK